MDRILEMSSFPYKSPESDAAHSLQYSVREAEREHRDAGEDYTPQHVRQSIVHTREDMTLVYSRLCDVADGSKKTNVRLVLIVGLLALNALLLFVKS